MDLPCNHPLSAMNSYPIYGSAWQSLKQYSTAVLRGRYVAGALYNCACLRNYLRKGGFNQTAPRNYIHNSLCRFILSRTVKTFVIFLSKSTKKHADSFNVHHKWILIRPMPCLSCCWKKTEDIKADAVEEDQELCSGCSKVFSITLSCRSTFPFFALWLFKKIVFQDCFYFSPFMIWCFPNQRELCKCSR